MAKHFLHKHHILPVHAGGTDDSSNIEHLAVKQHADAHKKLWEQHGDWQDFLAWQGLSGRMGKEEIIRSKISHAHKGKKLEDWHIEILREKGRKLTGKNNPMFGKKLTEKQKEAVRMAHLGRKDSPETIAKKKANYEANRLAGTGTFSPKAIKKMAATQRKRLAEMPKEKKRLMYEKVAASHRGKKQTDYQKRRVMEANQARWLITDPSGNSFKILNMRQWCLKNNMHSGNMTSVANGKLKSYKGFTCRKLCS